MKYDNIPKTYLIISVVLFLAWTSIASAKSVLDHMPAIVAASQHDQDNDGYTEKQGDCNDNNSSIFPGAMEICSDGIDIECQSFCDITSLSHCLSPASCNAAGHWFWHKRSASGKR